MKNKITELVQYLDDRNKNFGELYSTFDTNEYWKGRGDEAKFVAEWLKDNVLNYEEAHYSKNGDLSDLPKAI